MRRRVQSTLVSVLWLASLAACGAPSTPVAPDEPEAPEPPAPSLRLTSLSHRDGQVITGSRALTLTGALESSHPLAALTVTLNGAPVPAEVDADSFTAALTLADNRNAVTVTARNKAGAVANVSLELDFPFLRLETFQAASVVIGQSDFTESSTWLNSEKVRAPYGSPTVHDGVLYLPDYAHQRVLGYLALPESNGARADFVLGQPDFHTATREEAGPADLDAPYSVQGYDGKLVVSDLGNDRLLIWNELPTRTEVPADVVVGQPAMSEAHRYGSCARDRLVSPSGFIVADGKLIVADTFRVLIWNELPTESGAPADLVLGQASYDSCVGHDLDQDGVTDTDAEGRPLTNARTFEPKDVWSDGERLVVADPYSYRVLIWNNFPTDNFAPADVVLGQPDMTTRAHVSEPSQRNIGRPHMVTSNGNQLFVSDGEFHRVLIWDRFPTENYAPADRVLGQSDFLHRAPNDDDQDMYWGNAMPSARTFSNPSGLHLVDDKLIVSDATNNRVLIFEAQP